jgi:primosomal protein N' (replication factor Y)
MHIIEIIPVIKSCPNKSLSYFSKNKLKKGDLVSVKIRNKLVPAIVANSSPVKAQKSAIKSIPYSLKPVESLITENFINEKFLESVYKMSDYFVSNPGLILSKLISKKMLQKSLAKKNNRQALVSNFHKISLYQSNQNSRIKYYKSVIRENFASGFSVFLCVPAIQNIEQVAKELRKGIENYTLIFHNKMPVKNLDKNFNAYRVSDHPLLVITTGSFLSLVNNRIGTIILEEEESINYKMQKRPYLDFRKAAEIISKEFKNHLIYGGEIVRIETYYKKEKNKLNALSEISPRLEFHASAKIIPLANETQNGKKRNFQILGTDIKNALSAKSSAQNHSESILLFINKRGHSTTIICGDCGKMIECGKCSVPLTLHQPDFSNETQYCKDRFMACRHCFLKSNVPANCPYCKSWNLKSFGVGIQKVGIEIKKMFPSLQLFRMDGDTIKNRKQGEKILENFLKSPKGVLIATELIFSFLEKPIDHIYVISADSLLALPDFRMHEKIFKCLLRLRCFAKKTFIIQTRLSDKKIFKNIIRGDIANFYREEIDLRKKFAYPPFSTLIKITKEETSGDSAKKSVYNLAERLKAHPCFVFPAFISKIKNKHRWHILLKLKPDAWPNNYPDLLKTLKSLSPSWRVNVDPETLL